MSNMPKIVNQVLFWMGAAAMATLFAYFWSNFVREMLGYPKRRIRALEIGLWLAIPVAIASEVWAYLCRK